MKKLMVLFISLLIIYCVYYDLRTGTLPITTVASASETEVKSDNLEEKNNTTYIEVTVQPGDTVLSILEKHQKGKLPVSITTVIHDFEQLNQIVPEKIQIGKKYKFPLY